MRYLTNKRLIKLPPVSSCAPWHTRIWKQPRDPQKIRTQSDIGAGRGFGRAAESDSEAFGTLFVLLIYPPYSTSISLFCELIYFSRGYFNIDLCGCSSIDRYILIRHTKWLLSLLRLSTRLTGPTWASRSARVRHWDLSTHSSPLWLIVTSSQRSHRVHLLERDWQMVSPPLRRRPLHAHPWHGSCAQLRSASL